jgi:hypothetical protein
MTFRHIRTPADYRVGVFDIVVITRGFIDAEGLDETDYGGCHAMAGIGVDIVAAKTRLDKFRRSITLLYGVLTGTEYGYAGWPFFAVGLAELPLHFIEGLVPAHRDKLALLVELAVRHAH